MRPNTFWICVFLLALFAVGCGGGSGGSSGTPSANHWTIGAGGGTFQTSANEVRLDVPAGSVSTDTPVTATKLGSVTNAPAGTVYVAGTGWSFTHVTFSTPATLTMTIPLGTPLDALKIYRRADGSAEWTPVTTTISVADHTATTQISSFSSYALFTPAGSGWTWTSAGGTFTFSNLTVTLPAAAVSTSVEVQPRRTLINFAPPTGWVAVADATFDLGSSNTSLTTATAFTVGLSYTSGAVPFAKRANIRIFHKVNAAAEWVPLPTTSDVPNLKVSGTATTLGTFAAFYPAPAQTSLYWVEQRRLGEDTFLDVYGANAGGSETKLYSPSQRQGPAQLRTNTFRWSDKSFLGLEFVNSTDTYLMSYNVETGVSTRLFLIPHEAGTYISSAELVRANRIAASDDYLLQISQRNPTTGANRDQLLLYRNGSTEPRVLMSRDHRDGEAAAFMRPWDIAADGRALATTSDGLVMFTDNSQVVLVPAALGPSEAYFSPSGERVLFFQQNATESLWRVDTLATSTTVTIPGLDNANRVRWSADDNHVISAVYSGNDRQINQVDTVTGAASLITTAGPHSTSFINDVGVR
ncbi:hypothetical protein [Fimbriimonas ginsengisoli]|nr:hypothetical protein [Fimbriimonas ginsengisoli]